MTDETCDPALRSFIDVPQGSPFPIQNLPFGIFRRPDRPTPRVGVAIGEQILDLALLEARGLIDLALTRPVFEQPTLNRFLSLGRDAWRATRQTVSRLLRADQPLLRDDARTREEAFVPMADAILLLPAEIRDYTDFYSSREHATNVGTMFRGSENALMPNWLHVPIAYHGRASSLVVSGTDIRRPRGQTMADGAAGPTFGPSRLLDFELEVGLLIGPGNPMGEPVPIDRSMEQIFGMVLVNDWSARDIQKWEYQPLGPFLGKNFATSISPWVVTMEALEPFRCAGPPQDPPPLPYLTTAGECAYDIELDVYIQSASIPRRHRIARSNFKHLYWSICQQVAHHASNGCPLRPGDLLASGTISGPGREARGSMLELCWGGKEPIRLPSGEERRFLEDGDRVTFEGWCEGPGHRIGFGEVTGTILPARR